MDELRYGSDAIGGVILVEPKALRNKPGYAAELEQCLLQEDEQYLFHQKVKLADPFPKDI